MKKLLIGIFMLFSYSIFAQAVKVKDLNTLKGIESVVIFQGNTKVITDAAGAADLAGFDKALPLDLQHPSYESMQVSFAEIEKNKFEIFLFEKVINTDEVVIAANRWEDEKSEIPHEIVKIGVKEIEFKNPSTAAELLAQTGQVYLQKSQLGGGSPMFRGFNANSVLIVVDGVRMNNAIYRAGNLQSLIIQDANNLENVEVIFGPGSVMYGSDALGGVMDYHTLTPKFSMQDKLLVSGAGLLRYASAANEKTGHFHLGIGTGRFASMTSLTFSDFSDLRFGANRPDEYPEWGKRTEYVERINGKDSIVKNDNPNIARFSGYSQTNFMQKFRFKLTDRMNMQLGLYYSNSSDIDRYDRLVEYRNGAPRFAEWYYGPQKYSMINYKFFWDAQNKLFDNLRLTIARQDNVEERVQRSYRKNSLQNRVENITVYTANLDFNKNVGTKHEIFYGLDFITNDLKSTATATDISTQVIAPLDTRYPDGDNKMTTTALYGNYKLKASEKLSVTAGARYSYVSLRSEFVSKEFFDFPFDVAEYKTGAINGSLGAAFRPTNTTQLNINLSTGFRAPNIDDIGRVFESAPGTLVIPNANLKPEYTQNIELGFNQVIAQKVQIGGTVYYTKLRDAITLTPATFNGQDSIRYNDVMSKVYSFGNSDKGYIWGYSLQGKAVFSKSLSFSTSLTYCYGIDEKNDIRLHATPPIFGQSSLVWSAKKIRAEFYVNYQGRSDHFSKLSPESAGRAFMFPVDYVPSWYTLNLRASYQLHKNLQINGGIENLMDKFYMQYASGIPSPGRNFIIAARASF